MRETLRFVMSVFGVVCLLLLLVLHVAVAHHRRCTTTCISFPPVGFAASANNEALYDAATLRTLYPEGMGAVRSISNLVLKVLDEEEVRSSPKNWVVSPLSLAAILAQLLLGSQGLLQSVLVSSLSLEKSVIPISRLEVHRQLGRLMKYLQTPTNDTYILDLNAAIFHQPEVLLKPTYKHALLDFYNAQIYVLDFMRRATASTKKINEWINKSTHGKLPEVYTRPLPPSTVSVMANAVYFNGRWQNPFDATYTKTGPFFVAPDKKVDVKYMFGEKELLYGNTSDMQLIGIPYKNWDVVLYVLLPHEKLKTNLSVDRLDKIISGSRRENITLLMPKLKLLSTISVRQSVLKYLMKSKRLATRTVILSPGQSQFRKRCVSCEGHRYPSKATVVSEKTQEDVGAFEDADMFDVSGASEDSRFKFNDVIHQVSLEIDEKGSEIAAVSSTLIDYSGDNFLLKINRPFWFFVRHEPSATHLFWGRIVDPSKEGN